MALVFELVALAAVIPALAQAPAEPGADVVEEAAADTTADAEAATDADADAEAMSAEAADAEAEAEASVDAEASSLSETAADAVPSETSEPAEAPVDNTTEEIIAAPAGSQPAARAVNVVESAPAPQASVAVDADASDKKWKVSGSAEYRTLVVVDEDPKNDMRMLFKLGGTYEVLRALEAFAGLGLTQAFVAEEGESGARLQDSRLGFILSHQEGLPLDAWTSSSLPDRDLSLRHRVSFILPTSRQSLNNDLFFAGKIDTKVSMRTYDALTAGVAADATYLWYEYAEQAGQFAGMNTQFVGGGALFVEYELELPQPLMGSLAIGLDGWTAYSRKYASRESFESDASSQAAWKQNWGWDLYASWSPVDYLSATISLEQGGRVLRDGMVNPTPFHRDETELALSIGGSY